MMRLPVLLGFSLVVGLLSACSGDDDDDSAGSGTGGSASGGSASGGTAAGGFTSETERPATCEELCARSIGCPGDPDPECPSSCRVLSALCPEETTAYISCLQARPDTDLQCNVQGHTTRGPGVCDTESAAVDACMTVWVDD
jgi:hypothetical protein